MIKTGDQIIEPADPTEFDSENPRMAPYFTNQIVELYKEAATLDSKKYRSIFDKLIQSIQFSSMHSATMVEEAYKAELFDLEKRSLAVHREGSALEYKRVAAVNAEVEQTRAYDNQLAIEAKQNFILTEETKQRDAIREDLVQMFASKCKKEYEFMHKLRVQDCQQQIIEEDLQLEKDLLQLEIAMNPKI